MDFTPTGDTYESEPNDTTANADTLPVNAPVTGKLISVNDTDFYKVTLDSAAQFSLTLEHALPDNLSKSGNAWTVTCYQYDERTGSLRETPVLTMQAALEQTKATSDTALVRGGTFYVKVEGNTAQRASGDFARHLLANFPSYFTKMLVNTSSIHSAFCFI